MINNDTNEVKQKGQEILCEGRLYERKSVTLSKRENFLTFPCFQFFNKFLSFVASRAEDSNDLIGYIIPIINVFNPNR